MFTEIYDQFGITLSPAGPKFGRRREILRAPTNFYVYCMSMAREPRLFGDFQGGACVIINDVARFVRKLGAAGLEHLGRDWSWFAAPLAYVDPLRPPDSPLNLIHCKDFRFTYQAEYRLVWLPPEPVQVLPSFFLEIGPIGDISTLVDLTGNPSPN